MQYLYPTGISPAEEAAGFRLAEIDNPSGSFVGHPPTLRAVIYRVDTSHRLVKTAANPTEARHHYVLQVFGRFSWDHPGKRPEWIDRHAAGWEDDPARLTEVIAPWLREHPDSRYVAVDPPDEGGGNRLDPKAGV